MARTGVTPMPALTKTAGVRSAGVEHERPARRRQLQRGAGRDVFVQERAHAAVALDRDPQPAAVARRGQGVAAHVAVGEAHGGELARDDAA